LKTLRKSTHQEFVEYLLQRPAVGRVEYSRGVEVRFDEYAFGLAEREEALVAVVVAHAGRADAAEWDVMLDDLQHSVI